ncbi:hypothetical protein DUNSADRAFT_16283 [Dunaliella salina]|uniref:Encoded protein n=1 Tax=Dunaliella salina TaxID=3046 RepID=A0ABQ7G3W3_DUNSA|nr:hypothetical protein DUNSADRAFT_16283 [Dunaliella salina]|eukprot:KAF5829303.1 hypothetical protein DUNSADRAFT_16283 [Dunaliella salina]
MCKGSRAACFEVAWSWQTAQVVHEALRQGSARVDRTTHSRFRSQGSSMNKPTVPELGPEVASKWVSPPAHSLSNSGIKMSFLLLLPLYLLLRTSR